MITKTKIDAEKMKAVLTPAVKHLTKIVSDTGHEIRIVGGAVRDLLDNKVPHDIDLASTATPTELIEILDANGIKHLPIGIEHGTVVAVYNGEQLEITTLRTDTVTDGRHASVEFTRNWKADAERRDLTFNAMSLEVNGRLHDYFNGAAHLTNRSAIFVGDAATRLQEDYLRILRYFRFQSRLASPVWDESTLDAIEMNAVGLKMISGERISSEMFKILESDNIQQVLGHMGTTGVLRMIGLPNPSTQDMPALSNPIVRLASMLGTDAAVNTLQARWKLSNKIVAALRFLVTHKRDDVTLKSLKVMLANGVDMLYVMALASLTHNNHLLPAIKQWRIPLFPVTGHDLMAVGIAGKAIGDTLAALRVNWADSEFTLSKQELVELVVRTRPNKLG
jgi:tRNA nucleotidyltransferase (CCA-adding enzyme)